jgi:hypothetical protein
MKSRLASIAIALCSLSLYAAPSVADTISYADAMTLLAKDCGHDIKAHCRGVNIGNGQIQACLQKHQATVSATCTSTLASVTQSIAIRQEAQASVFKVCKGDAATFCKGVVGDYNILGCLLKTKNIDGSKCNQAITDAGWR